MPSSVPLSPIKAEQDDIEAKLEQMEAGDSAPRKTNSSIGSNAGMEGTEIGSRPPEINSDQDSQKQGIPTNETTPDISNDNAITAETNTEPQVEHKVQVAYIHDPNGTNQSSENTGILNIKTALFCTKFVFGITHKANMLMRAGLKGVLLT